MTCGTIKQLSEENTVLVALPAHTSDGLQPLDVSVFSILRLM